MRGQRVLSRTTQTIKITMLVSSRALELRASLPVSCLWVHVLILLRHSFGDVPKQQTKIILIRRHYYLHATGRVVNESISSFLRGLGIPWSTRVSSHRPPFLWEQLKPHATRVLVGPTL